MGERGRIVRVERENFTNESANRIMHCEQGKRSRDWRHDTAQNSGGRRGEVTRKRAVHEHPQVLYAVALDRITAGVKERD